MNDCDWVEAALINYAMVAELLIRIKHAGPVPMRSSPTVAVDWSVRQRRSRQTLKEKSEAARDSPSTPLSWSGATSPSGGATDVEDSSRADKASDFRSKVGLFSVFLSVSLSVLCCVDGGRRYYRRSAGVDCYFDRHSVRFLCYNVFPCYFTKIPFKRMIFTSPFEWGFSGLFW